MGQLSTKAAQQFYCKYAERIFTQMDAENWIELPKHKVQAN